MPTYSFLNTKTGREITEKMSYDDLQIFLKDHPECEQVFKVNVVDPVNIGVTRPPSDFQKHVLGKVKYVPGAKKDTIEKRWAITKEI